MEKKQYLAFTTTDRPYCVGMFRMYRFAFSFCAWLWSC